MTVVLTTAATVACTFQGKVVLTPPRSALQVNGTPVPTAGNVGDWKPVPASCQAKTPEPKPSPCTGVGSVSAGRSTRLFVDGDPVVLEDLSALSTGSDVAVGHTVSVKATSASALQAV